MTLSTHVLDTHSGRPVAGLAVALEHLQRAAWVRLTETCTDANGRISGFPQELALGVYRLHFQTAPYFTSQGLASLYPFVEISFHLAGPGQHFHIPLLLSANGYTTYRGS